MSTMLTLIHAGWDSVRSSVAQGRRSEAIGLMRRLLARPDVPTPVATAAHRLLGELFMDVENYTDARRHLRAAAVLEPTDARTLYLWGLAHAQDPQGCDRRAAVIFHRASRLDPSRVQYRAAFGRAAVRCERVRLGVRELLAAAAAAPGDLAVIRVVVDGLLEADRPHTARRILTRAGFICRDAARSRELAALVERVRFETARRNQRGTRGTTRHRQDADIARDGGRVVLPFLRLDTGLAPESRGKYRQDVISFPRPHFPQFLARNADR